ncbi:MAG: redox-regulated ATPase YchF, partial [Clostridia bacterium]|nr:redox-regulated ATPase YchF [Clostridia bacterium]
HVVRCIEDDNIIHVDGSVNPMRDLETINMELIFSDMEMLERRIERANKALKSDKSVAASIEVFQRVYDVLSEGKCARTVDLTEDELAMFYDTPLLTMKPVIYVANVSEEEASGEPTDNEGYNRLKAFAAEENAQVMPVCAGIEAEIAELDAEDKAMFLEDLGIKESGLDRLIKASYSLLGLISFLTAGPDEVRAWTITRGTKAPRAAGKIHSDFERGFIRAEVVAFDDLEKHGSMSAVREAGRYRSEGKEYVMQDGDIVQFLFNV